MAFVLLVSFLTFAVVGRILIQYYYTGDHGVRLAKSTASPVEIIPGLTFVLSFLVSAVLIVLNEFAWLSDWHFGSPLVTFVATALGFAGIAITLVAQIQMGKSWRIGVDPGEQTNLITTGLYAKSRNPIYFGILLYWMGVVINFPHPAMWVCAIICWVSIEVIVRKIEEPYLHRVHAKAFADYLARSHRYRLF
jgi:protein-S-isoprenylcysteine O-methyltransferase Ste14